MLTTLLESRATRTRSVSAHLLSVGLHTALIGGAIAATQQAAAILEPRVADPPARYVRTVEAPPPAPKQPTVTAPQLKGFKVLEALIKIPDALPPINLMAAITDPNLFTGIGLPGGRPDGTETAISTGDLTADQVERPAHLVAGTGRPVYPAALRSAGVAGDVRVQFVIDTTGRADMRSITILSSTHPRFSDAVITALSKARFAPAEFGGRRVRQIVQMPFLFSLER
jgi:protein TonB